MTRSRKDILGSILSLAILCVVAAGSYYYYRTVIDPVPCAKPKMYSVGAFDSRFGITPEEFEAALADAAGVWNMAAGKPVLAYDDKGPLTANLAYDTRQESAELRAMIDAEQARYESDARSVDRAKKDLDDDRAAYDALKASIDARAAAGERMSYPERAKLDKDIESLNEMASSLNRKAGDLNRQIQQLNESAAETNAKVNAYNSSGAGTDFDQGRYVKDAASERITIYEFKSKAELTRALAHEFGHALGLDHNENPASILYPYNKPGGLTLSAEDLAAFKTACDLK